MDRAVLFDQVLEASIGGAALGIGVFILLWG